MLPPVGAVGSEVALSRVIAGLSYALDLTEGEPPGHATRSCIIGMRLAAELNLDEDADLRPKTRAALEKRFGDRLNRDDG